MLPQELIRRKRDGRPLYAKDIAAFIKGIVEGTVSEGQVAALGMAVFFQGMSMDECVSLTEAMTRSGRVLDWDLPGPVLDKHSTGGVGDLVSLALGPLVAACGGFVPMISGRGLGHTGGTLDKLESIPGYVAVPDEALFRETVEQAGCAIIGQTADLAPADRIFYAVRDVTATVESVPLITASILSKKLAAGLDALVMDVKTGSGAFMQSLQDAVELADSIGSVAAGAGLPCTALVTDMDQPLAPCAGNAVEVLEAVRFLTGERDPRLEEAVISLGTEMLLLGGIADDAASARERLHDALDSGAAAERFERMVSMLGGPSDVLSRIETLLPAAPVVEDVLPKLGGTLQGVDARSLGLAVVTLGGGRTRPQDGVDHAVGLTNIARVGDAVGPGKPLCTIHARTRDDLEAVRHSVLEAVRVGREPVREERPVVIRRIAATR
ncbi:thymidine phosphorylase [Salidesulfovibrio brasiliensis]|uniref:thymidine phosphorylase n=1 Tax=Salidesulfovibrio brasiliensis TaxID=221711 RepID=UPI0006D0C734|nr:thymidine phosphorylase [Salidesulfovibrio brasiliensis]